MDIAAPRGRPLKEAMGLLSALTSLPGLAFGGAPRGDGRAVVVLPGFLTDDRSTVAIRRHLKRAGHQVYGWNLGWNHGRVFELLPRVIDRLRAVRARARAPVHIVGWSLGGVLAREAARACPADVGRVVTLGAPVVGGPKYTAAARLYQLRGIDLDEAEEIARARNAAPLGVPVSAIYTRADSVVAWRAQLDDNPLNDVRYIEVETTHAGLGFSAPVLRALVEELRRS